MPSSELTPQTRQATRQRADADTKNGAEVRQLHPRPPRPKPGLAASHEVSVTREGFSYSAQGSPGHEVCCPESGPDRGLYLDQRRVGRFPYALARLIMRIGRDHETYYLVSRDRDSRPIVLCWEDIESGRWAPKLNMHRSADKGIIAALATVIYELAASDDIPDASYALRPSDRTPDGYLPQPYAECLPPGYMDQPEHIGAGERATARSTFIRILGQREKIALVAGASAGSPFAGAIGLRQGTIWDLFGLRRRGKTTALSAAITVWGSPAVPPDIGILESWNTTDKGVGRVLGQLGILPGFRDESGTSGFTPAQWGQLIYATCGGASRTQAESRNNIGYRRTPGWLGFMFVTGNGPITDQITSGKYEGITNRVISLETPFTEDGPECEELESALQADYGWAGPRVLSTVTVATFREWFSDAMTALGNPDGDTRRTIAKSLAVAVAGARALDQVYGSGSVLHDSALRGALEYLGVLGEPESARSMVLRAIASAMTFRQAAWPSRQQFEELNKPFDAESREERTLRVGGYDHDLSGVYDSDWLYLCSEAWDQLVSELGITASTALKDMYEREELYVAPSIRKKSEWRAQAPRWMDPKRPWVYKIRLSALHSTDDDQDQVDAADAEPGNSLGWGEGTIGAKVNTDQRPPAPVLCAICGDPLDSVLVAMGETTHGEKPVAAATAPPGAEAAPVVQPALEPPASGTATGKAPFTRSDQNTALTRAIAVLDAGPKGRVNGQEITGDQIAQWAASLRVLAALEGDRSGHGPFAPRRAKRGPWWQATMPPIAVDARTSAWTWERDGYSGPGVVLDRNGAWPSSTSSVTVAHGGFEDTGAVDEITGAVRPGYYLVTCYPWSETGMPHPLGHVKPGEQVWIVAPRMGLLRDLADAGRWPDTTAAGSWTGEPCRLREWAQFVGQLRQHARTVYGQGSDADEAVKVAFGQAMGLLRGSWAEDSTLPRKVWKCKARRLDWAQHIEDQAAVTLWRAADECRQAAGGSGPVALRNVDELVIPSAAFDAVTSVILPGRKRPPVRIDPTGIEFGTFKVKSRGEV